MMSGHVEYQILVVTRLPAFKSAKHRPEDVVQFFRHLNHIDAALRRELLAPYFDAVKVPRTNLDDLCALLEKRLVTRMKPRTDQTPPPLTASGSSSPANR